MNQRILGTVLLLVFAFASTGFFFKSKMPEDQTQIPQSLMPNRDIASSPLYDRLIASYGNGVAHERIKIDYLMAEVKASTFTFVRNGLSYNGYKTAKHLIKKYRKRVAEIRSARQFIEEIATKSSMSGKHYLAEPGDGQVYYAASLLHYELDRLEKFLEDQQKPKEIVDEQNDQSVGSDLLPSFQG